jgi:Domain of unknown function (DUF3786)/Putative Fe-S cluster
MLKPKNAMEIFRYLEKSNCRECGEKTCLAFAGAVFQSRKEIGLCTRLDSRIVDLFPDTGDSTVVSEEMGEQMVGDLKNQVLGTDLTEAAKRTGGEFNGSKLTLKIMGKNFGVDSAGNFSSDIHVNPWVSGPFLEYVINSKGVEPAGQWVSFRELKLGKEFSYPFFQKRCELVMKNIADKHTDLFDDIVHIFNGRKVAKQFESDVSVVIRPLPKVPIMICYWAEEDGLGSTLNLFFDKSVDENLPKDSLFTLCVGLALMFEKISLRHAGVNESS